ncbi:transferrin-binding protein-like solute binding protein [Pasteurella bettyae]|uniref:Transferrin-binding protein-like solute-binding domain protein n=1 Tax=Pasteurella bettyae CCUG 2042 TaxID=1095749 RepID=I3DAK5_9PAST|nr:transferrin-binding protein-like solute binding protein [Pasteurella bettyae]EIJ68748.1 transferrin-binding protein-like solute-binding domain protein [Pasteurella bettyae CCUG 2042]SUB20909.1 Transferrin binding protein-like solute binding protein [Pasteurella bettyae]
MTGEITASNEKPFATENNNFNPISLKAKIKGNKFEGENAGMSTKGQFYGKDAGELAGTFANKDKNIIGAYGARKQGEGKNVEPNKPNEEARTNTYGHIVDLSSTNSESSSSNPDYEVEHYDIEKQKQTISALKTVTILMKGDAYKHDRYDEDGEEELLIRKLVDDLANPKERARLHEYADKGFVYVWPNVAIVGENLSYGQWGVTRIGIPDSMPKGAHIVGDVTDESQIPAQGNAVYQGLAGFYMVNKDKDIKYTYPGTVKADVNFAEKKLTAVVTPDGNADFIAEYKRKDISPIELTAQIKGANFVGTNPNNGITTKGLFLGPNAAEIVGIFNSSKPTEKDLLLGAFGAKKQN